MRFCAGAWLWPLWAGSIALCGGCIVAGDKCGPNQILLDDTHLLCACEAGFVVSADNRSCVLCGDNEEAVNGACVCKMGFTRASGGAACEPSSVGLSCMDDTGCSGAYAYCASPGADGYCTAAGCTGDGACPIGWSCTTGAGMTYCKRPPTGIGKSCQTNNDCAAFDAKYCDTVLTRTCLLADCAKRATVCPSSWSCCDFSPLGADLSLCLTSAQLTGSTCPQGGTLVNP